MAETNAAVNSSANSNGVSLPENGSTKLSFSTGDIKGMQVSSSGDLIITFTPESGRSNLVINNFDTLAKNNVSLVLSDGKTLQAQDLYKSLSGKIASPGFEIGEPAAGEVMEVTLQKGEKYNFTFNPKNVESSENKAGALVITFDDGGQIVLKNFSDASGADLSLGGRDVNANTFSNLLSLAAAETQEIDSVEPLAQLRKEVGGDEMAALAQQLAEVEPAAGEGAGEGGSGDAGGMGFQSSVSDAPLGTIDDVGVIGVTALQYGLPEGGEEVRPQFSAAPNAPGMPGPGLSAPPAQTYEDNSVKVNISTTPTTTDPAIITTITITGIPSTWTVTNTGGGTFNPGTGTWTITVPGNTPFTGGPTLLPPPNSDVDLPNLPVTATNTNTSTGETSTTTSTVTIIVDAVADQPTLEADGSVGPENTHLNINLVTTLTDTDGSESVVKYQISGVPTGFTFNKGTDLGGGVWEFTPAQAVGLKAIPPTNWYHGTQNWVATTFTHDNPSDGEITTANNNAQDSDELTVTWTPVINPPSITVNNGADDVIVKEDTSEFVSIVATRNPVASPHEVLTVTVTGIDPAWGLSYTDGTYNAATGTWTITMPAGQDYYGGLLFTTPPQSDEDMGTLTATVTVTDPTVAPALTASANDTFNVIGDAVADEPVLTTNDVTGDEGQALDLDFSAVLGPDRDGSEEIQFYTIKAVDAANDGKYTLSAGTQNPDGSWTLTPAQLANLKIIPTNPKYHGEFDLQVTVTAKEVNLSGTEDDLTDNTATDTELLNVCWEPYVPPPEGEFPNLNVAGHPNSALVKEDGSVEVDVVARLGAGHSPDEILTVTITGFDNSWGTFGFPAGGSYNAATGTWTITMPAGQNFSGKITFTPNGDKDIDLNGLTLKTTATDPTIDTTKYPNSAQGVDKPLNVITDAVIDRPDFSVSGSTGAEGTALNVNLAAAVKDLDGSESIVGYKIGNVPAGFTFNQGTNNNDGTWSFTPAQIAGLKISGPANYHGTVHLTASVTATETSLSGVEVDYADNSMTLTETLNVTWTPTIDPPSITVNNGIDDVIVKEDGSVFVKIVAELAPGHSPNEVLTVTVTGIDPSWTITTGAANGTYNAATGTWTITLPANTNYNGGLTFAPPANKDIDMSGLVATATTTDSTVVPAQSASSTDNFKIITDAVVDAPDFDATGSTGAEGTSLNVNLTAVLKDLDGSESITGYKISGVPTGFSFNQGTNNNDGSWSFTPAQIAGLKITGPATFFGTLNLTAAVTVAETTLAGQEVDLTDNTITVTDPLTVTWTPEIDPPSITVNNGIDDVIVKEDGSVFVKIVAELAPGHSPNEVLTVTVTGIPSSWGLTTGANNGTYNAATGTWTITLPANTNYNGGLTFAPPANKDIDVSGLVATATATDSTVVPPQSASATDNFKIITDAVVDAPDFDATGSTGAENTSLNVNLTATLKDLDGSESIVGYKISGVPAGFSFNQGTNNLDGSWSFTPAQIAGLKISGPANYVGTLNLTAHVTVSETTLSGQEVDLTDNTITVTDALSVTWTPEIEPPSITVNNGIDDVIVKEDGSVFVKIVAELAPGHSPNEVLTVTVTGIDPSWTITTGAANGTYNAATGTWTITLPANTNYNGGLTFAPPANKDLDMSGLVATATATDSTTNPVQTASSNDGFNVITDAVADAPNLTAQNASAGDGRTVALNITTAVTDGDGSEAIDKLELSGFPNGATLNKGTYNAGTGVWTLSKADLTGLTVTVPEGSEGNYTITVKSYSKELVTPTTPGNKEVDFTDNTAVATKTLTLTVNDDDQPVLTDPDAKTVDETNLAATGSTGVSGTITADFGPDVAGSSISGTGTYTTSVPLTSNGATVNVTYANGVYTGATAAGTIFTLTIQPNGSYAFNLVGTLDHPVAGDHNDNIAINFGIVARDGDGDTDTTTLTINVRDDGPDAKSDTANLTTAIINAVKTGNVITNDTLSQDDPNTVSKITFGTTTLNVPAGGSVTINGTYGQLTMNSDGSYSYKVTSVGATGNTIQDAFIYTLKDGDGDTDQAALTINGNVPVINVDLEVNNCGCPIWVKEDQSIDVPVTASFTGGNGNETMTLTLSGVNTSWTLTGGWTNQGGGVWKITLPAGQSSYTGILNFKAPANSDMDMPGMTMTATVTDPDTGRTATDNGAFSIYVDAVADAPVLTVSSASGVEGTSISLNVATSVTDTDGSETIQKIEISGLPNGATLNKGTVSGGVWTLSVADLTGLKINVPGGTDGTYNLVVKSYSRETVALNTNGAGNRENDLSDNTAVTQKNLQLTVIDDVPVANNDNNVYEAYYNRTTTGNVITGVNGGPGAADDLSVDTPNTISQISFGGTTKAVTGATTIDGNFGTLTINTNGSYSYTLKAGIVQGAQIYSLNTATTGAASSVDGVTVSGVGGALNYVSTTTDGGTQGFGVGAAGSKVGAGEAIRVGFAVPTNAVSIRLADIAAAEIGRFITLLVTLENGTQTTVQHQLTAANVVYLDPVAKTHGMTHIVLDSNALGGRVKSVDISSTNVDFLVNFIEGEREMVEEFNYVLRDADGDTDPAVLRIDSSSGTIIGGSGNETIYGDTPDDTIDGGDGNDIICGHAGNDTLRGGNGDDEIDGGLGNDSLYGGAGKDVIYGRQGDDYIEGGSENDRLFGDAPGVKNSDGSYTLSNGRYGGNDTIKGGDGNDLIDGGAGNDTLYGDAGNDDIYGNLGDDRIYGGDGSDWIFGGHGNDTLTGGAGADAFWFSKITDGLDHITDFSLSEGDKLRFDNLISGTSTVQSVIDNYVFARTEGGNTIISVDTSGSGNAANATDMVVLDNTNLTLQQLMNANAIVI